MPQILQSGYRSLGGVDSQVSDCVRHDDAKLTIART